MIVVDAGVLVVALLDEGTDGDAARHRLRAETLAAPELIDLQVLSVVGRHRRAERISERAGAPRDHRPHGPATHPGTASALLPRCLEPNANLSAHDAAYVALAEAFDTTLLTGDARLARAPGPACPIEVLAAP